MTEAIKGTVSGARLTAEAITVQYGGLTAVSEMSLVAEPGQITALIGPNGAGKTSLFEALGGAVAPASGRVLLDDQDVTRLSVEERAHLGMRRTFQRLAVFPSLTVADNLRVGAETRKRLGLVRGLLGLTEPDLEETEGRVERVLALLGLESAASQRASTLSTGSLRLVELGRALCARPRLLLLDEPASGLNDTETGALRDVLLDLAQRGVTVLLVEHDVSLVLSVADTVYAMAQGTLLASGTPKEIAAHPAVREAYLDPVVTG